MGSVMGFVLWFLPPRWRERYWDRHQCPATRYHARSDGYVCCQRKRHDDEWHRDGWGTEWRNAA
jgi:hypothetical protein